KIGLTVSDEEMLELVQGKNPHRFILQYFKDPNTGAYDPNLVRNYLRNLDKMEQKDKDQWYAFEKAIKEDRQDAKYRNLLMKGYYVPKAMAKKEYALRSRNYQFRAINPGYSDIPDSTVQVTDQDIQATYEENKHLFLGEEATRDVDYVVFEVEPSAEDRQKISAYVDKIYKDFLETTDVPNFVNAVSDTKIDTAFKKKGFYAPSLDSMIFKSARGTFIAPFEADKQWTMAKVLDFQSRPDSIKASMILITYKEAGVIENINRNKAQAEELADSLLAVLKAQPEKFGEMARKFSSYPDADKNGGELGWMTDGDYNFYPFFVSGLIAKPGDMKIKETRLGFHVLKIEDKTKPISKVQVAMITRKIDPSNETHQAYYMKANEFAGKNKTIDDFDKGAVEAGIQKRAAQAVRTMDMSIVGIQNSREVVRWSFSEKNEVGSVSPVFEIEGNYVIAIIKKIKPKGIPALELIKEQIEPMARTKKKLEMVLDRTKKAMEGNKDLASLAMALNCKVDTLNS
ncbi:MAG: hypothetical protein FJY10_12515, partial [Bacteroidetes bacterium]|nr:hypothetical protein [Bacteroidota bacterium]